MQMNEDIEILPGHPDAQFLWAYLWREQGLCDDPEAIVSHLQGCDVCCQRLEYVRQHNVSPLLSQAGLARIQTRLLAQFFLDKEENQNTCG
jgi:hypothetical protein